MPFFYIDHSTFHHTDDDNKGIYPFIKGNNGQNFFYLYHISLLLFQLYQLYQLNLPFNISCLPRIPGCSVHTGVLLKETSQMWLLECHKRRWLHECDLKLFLNILDHEVKLFKEYSMPRILWTSLRKQRPCIHASKQRVPFIQKDPNTKNARKSGMSPNVSG